MNKNPGPRRSRRAVILKKPNGTPGLLIVNGAQKSFTLDEVWKADVAPRPEMVVIVELDVAGRITEIRTIDPEDLVREKAARIGARVRTIYRLASTTVELVAVRIMRRLTSVRLSRAASCRAACS